MEREAAEAPLRRGSPEEGNGRPLVTPAVGSLDFDEDSFGKRDSPKIIYI